MLIFTVKFHPNITNAAKPDSNPERKINGITKNLIPDWFQLRNLCDIYHRSEETPIKNS